MWNSSKFKNLICIKGYENIGCNSSTHEPIETIKCENDTCDVGGVCDEDEDCDTGLICLKNKDDKFGKCHRPFWMIKWKSCKTDFKCGSGTTTSYAECDTRVVMIQLNLPETKECDTEIDCEDGSRCNFDSDCKTGRVCEKEDDDSKYKTCGISVDCEYEDIDEFNNRIKSYCPDPDTTKDNTEDVSVT